MYNSDMKTYLYFAYGANTNLDSMGRRCPAALSLGSAVLPNYQYRFSRHADVVPTPASEVLGVLWDITEDCLNSLDIFEGYPDYYERKTVEVIHNNQVKQALVYYMTPGLADAPPSQAYLDMVVEGFGQHGVDTKQIFKALNSANRNQYA